jgi:hypothetical protein
MKMYIINKLSSFCTTSVITSILKISFPRENKDEEYRFDTMDGACLRPAFAPIGAPNHPMAPDAGWFPRENKDKEYRFDTITPIRCGRS